MDSDLAEYFRREAASREARTAQDGGDEGYKWSAESLISLAGFVEPAETGDVPLGMEKIRDAVLALKPHVKKTHRGELSLDSERAEVAVKRYGYDARALTDGQHREFLRELVSICMQETYEYASEYHRDRWSTLEPFELEAARDGVQLPHDYWQQRFDMPSGERAERVRQARQPD